MAGRSDDPVVVLGNNFKPRILSDITGQSKYLRTGQNRNFLTVVMTDAQAAHVRCKHTIGGDYDAIQAMKGDDDGHPRKTLLAFISGYLL